MVAHLRSIFDARFVNACVLQLAMMGGAPAAEADEPSAQTQAAAKSAYENHLICKRVYQTGSNIPKRICKTRAQMDREAQATKQYGDEMDRNSGWRVPGGRGDPNGGTAERAPGPL